MPVLFGPRKPLFQGQLRHAGKLPFFMTIDNSFVTQFQKCLDKMVMLIKMSACFKTAGKSIFHMRA
jgi:hypothetical protein